MYCQEIETNLDEINSVREQLQDSELRSKKELQEVKIELSQSTELRNQLRDYKEKLEKELTFKNELVKTMKEVLRNL